MKQALKTILVLTALSISLAACGVKSAPEAPPPATEQAQ